MDIFWTSVDIYKIHLYVGKIYCRIRIFSKKEEEIRLYRIMDLTLERSFVQRLFGLGTITCDTVDKSTPKLCIKNVKDSRRVKELISEAVEKERVKKRVSSREYMTVDDDCDCDCDGDHDHEED